MFTEFHKEDWHKGQTVYLLRIGEGSDKLELEKRIIEGIVETVGRVYITVSANSQKIRFEFDEETEQIFQEYNYGRSFEIYLTKEAALDILKKRKIENQLREDAKILLTKDLTDLDGKKLELLKNILDFVLLRSNTNILDILSGYLSFEEKDVFYRKVWAEHVKEDILTFTENEDIEVADEEADRVASAYVNGRYDCNLSYWENLHNLIQESKEKGLEYTICLQSLFDALTGYDPEEDYVPLEVEGYIQKETEGDKVYYNLKTDDGTPCMDRKTCQVMDITPDYVVLMEEDTRIPFKLSRKEFDLAVIPYTGEED